MSMRKNRNKLICSLLLFLGITQQAIAKNGIVTELSATDSKACVNALSSSDLDQPILLIYPYKNDPAISNYAEIAKKYPLQNFYQIQGGPGGFTPEVAKECLIYGDNQYGDQLRRYVIITDPDTKVRQIYAPDFLYTKINMSYDRIVGALTLIQVFE